MIASVPTRSFAAQTLSPRYQVRDRQEEPGSPYAMRYRAVNEPAKTARRMMDQTG